MVAFGSFFDGTLTRQERACLSSFVRHGHRVTLFSYDPLPLPAGVTAGDAAAILPRADFYVVAHGPHRGSPAQFSDRFRYRMIRDTGLVWIDTDMLCLRADWPDRAILLAREDRCMINGAVLGMPPDHAFLSDAIAITDAIGSRPIWSYTGPHLITALVHQHGLGAALLPSHVFYPIHYSCLDTLLASFPGADRVRWPEETLAVHLWNEMLRQRGHDKTAPPPRGSLLAVLLADAE